MLTLFSRQSPLSPAAQWALLINLLPCKAFKERQRLLAQTQSLMSFLSDARDDFALTLSASGRALLQAIPITQGFDNNGLAPADLIFNESLPELNVMAQQITRIEIGVEQENWHVLSFDDHRFPTLLKQIIDPPLLLFVRGNPETLNQPLLAMVGSRRASPQGLQDTFSFSQSLAAAGIGICSGLALGIDAASHQGALSVRNGITVAVMATGLDVVYPAKHRSLANAIVASDGCLVTEYLPNTQPLKFHFPQRNRIISGLSLGVLVMEAQEKSGSLITAKAAMEDNREVFAIPGSIHNPNAKGCHQLIRQGAHLVAQPEDIIAPLTSGWVKPNPVKALDKAPKRSHHSKANQSQHSSSKPKPQQNNLFPEAEVHSADQQLSIDQQLSTEQQELMKYIPEHPISVDQLVELTQKSAQWIMTQLFELELLNQLQQQDGLIYKQSNT